MIKCHLSRSSDLVLRYFFRSDKRSLQKTDFEDMVQAKNVIRQDQKPYKPKPNLKLLENQCIAPPPPRH